MHPISTLVLMVSDRRSKGTNGYQLEITAGMSVDVYSYSTLIDLTLHTDGDNARSEGCRTGRGSIRVSKPGLEHNYT